MSGLAPVVALALQTIVGTPEAPITPQPPVSMPVEQIRERCPPFRLAFDSAQPVNVARCQVTESGVFAKVAGDTYYYALYCLEDKDDPQLVSCDGGDSVLSSNRTDSNIALFIRRNAESTARVLTAVAALGAGSFHQPSIVNTPFGTIMEVPLILAGTCDCNASFYFLWKARERQWQELDFETWQRDLQKRLPAGLASMNPPWPDLRSMTADGGLWRNGDGHCCPTGGSFKATLAISGNRFVLKSLKILPG